MTNNNLPFIVSTTQDDKLLRNKIAQALVERIRRAHDKKQKFRVYIVIPLVPAFEGDLASSEASSARTVMHFQYVTISRGGASIIEKLKEYGIDADQYISWFSLRNHGKIKTPKTNTPERKSPTPSRARSPSQSKLQNDSGTIFGDEAAVKNPFDDHPLDRLETIMSNISNTSSLYPNSTLHPEPTSNRSRRGSEQTNASDLVDDDRFDYVSELLYLHDKLMIVDDRIVLMGSGKVLCLCLCVLILTRKRGSQYQ